ncbi:MAG TPA: glycosyltransferase family 9 protein [Rudaea sp.]|jgi:ADP-heptose:LPS heptosyltransferase
MKLKSSKFGFLLDRRSYDALRRALVGWLLGRVYRDIEATFRRNGELFGARIHRILVCRPNHRLGNTLLLTPLIVELGRTFHDAKVDVVVGGCAGPEVFRDFQNIADVVCLPRHMAKHPIYVVRALLKLRRNRYDLAIDPCEASQSARLLLAAAKATHAIGISTSESCRDGRLAPIHVAQLPVFLLRDALSRSGHKGNNEYPGLTLSLSVAERGAARARLYAIIDGRGPTHSPLTIGIFASATGSKRHDSAWWSQFLAEIRSQRSDYAFVEVASERGHAHLRGELPSFSSTSIREVAAFISNMTCFISADCGVMHLAVASGAPTIGLFLASDPKRYAPYGQHNHGILSIGKTPQEVAQVVISTIEGKILGRRSHAGLDADLFDDKAQSTSSRDTMTDISAYAGCVAASTP